MNKSRTLEKGDLGSFPGSSAVSRVNTLKPLEKNPGNQGTLEKGCFPGSKLLISRQKVTLENPAPKGGNPPFQGSLCASYLPGSIKGFFDRQVRPWRGHAGYRI